jgi:GNAT superfamily N-acetyltransferase
VGDIRYELLAEDDVAVEVLAFAGELLAAAFDSSRARRRGWTIRRPAYRVLAWDGDVLIGTESGLPVGCEPPIVVYGLGDAAVHEGWRKRGVARTMGALLHEEADRRDAAAVICHTGVIAILALEHGMEPVLPGELYLGRRFRRPVPLVERWYARWRIPKIVPLTIDGMV